MNNLLLRQRNQLLGGSHSMSAIREKAKKQLRIQGALSLAEQYGFVDWVEVDTKAMRQIGIDWSLGNLDNPLQQTKVGADVNLGVSDQTGTFTVGRLQRGVALQAMLKTLEENGTADVLSQPSVLISDNETATILSGKKIPINTIDIAGNIITKFYDVAIKLEVTPHINPNNQVLMDLHPEVSDLSGEATVTGGVIILTSQVTTKLLVNDGETVVIGGLLKDVKGKQDNKKQITYNSLNHADTVLPHTAR